MLFASRSELIMTLLTLKTADILHGYSITSSVSQFLVVLGVTLVIWVASELNFCLPVAIDAPAH